MEKKLIWGCIADDFTGASDAASFFKKGGLQTILYNGIPSENNCGKDGQAIVIALKTRTQETAAAVMETLQAARWLRQQGVKQLFIKYCSTFDSTPEGNIGPIMDALLEEYQIPYTILCPALPVNGRVVRQGHLYVNGVPLHESPMKNHPLTPMWDSDIARLMEAQSRYSCMKLTVDQYGLPKAQLQAVMDAYGETHEHFYVIPDYEREEDAKIIVELFADLPLLSGGSGILAELASASRLFADEEDSSETDALNADSTKLSAGAKASVITETTGDMPGIILAGSCSEMTRRQVGWAKEHGIEAMQIIPAKLLEGTQTLETLWEFVEQRKAAEVLLYSSDSPEQVQKIQAAGKERVAELLEETMAALAKKAVDAGYKRIIIAGGETSGAVTRALSFDSYMIGESVAPGVPVMIPRNRKDIRLVLKSGNFGQEDFFLRALNATGK